MRIIVIVIYFSNFNYNVRNIVVYSLGRTDFGIIEVLY